MDTNIRKVIISITRGLNLLLGFGLLTSLLANVFLGYSLAQVSLHKSRTIVPPTISQAFTVSDGKVDSSYLRQMGEYFLYLRFTVTPANVERQYSILLDYVTADAWKIIQPLLVKEAEFIRKNNVSSTLRVEGVKVSTKTLQVRIKGVLSKAVGSRELPPEPHDYMVSFQYDNGVLELKSIQKEKSS